MSNEQDWINIQNEIFPKGIPSHCEWTDINSMISVLNIIGSVNDSNYMFYPEGGGMDIKSSKRYMESDYIEIYTGSTDIVKPERLIFESFKDSRWNYFRLEINRMKPSGIYETNNSLSEEVIEIEPRKYIDRGYWDEGVYQGQKLPKTARVLIRHLKSGAFVIFAKQSIYNKDIRTDDARHNKVNSEQFRAYIEKQIVR